MGILNTSVLYHLKGKNLKCLPNSSKNIFAMATKSNFKSKKIGDEKFKENLLTLLIFRLISLKCIRILRNTNNKSKYLY